MEARGGATGQIGAGSLIRTAAPRLVRDTLGPLAIFFAGWKLIGLSAGIVLALAFGLTVLAFERRRGRPAALIRISVTLVCLRAIVGLSSDSATVYLAQEIGVDALLSSLVLGSLAAGRPLAAWVASDVYPVTPEMRRTGPFEPVMRRITLVWGVYFVLRGLVRLAALLTLSTDSYVLVIAVSDAPFLIALLAWSVRYSVGTFRRSEEWAPLFAQAETGVLLAGPAARVEP